MEKGKYEPYCHFCGSKIGQISERTDEKVNSIFDCERCNLNYCDQCSYETVENDVKVQKCIRCNNIIEKVPDVK
jgi:hypothetical protein